MLKIIASGERKDPPLERAQPSHCFRFDGQVHGSRATPFAFTGTPVCTENLIRVDDVMESPKLAE